MPPDHASNFSQLSFCKLRKEAAETLGLMLKVGHREREGLLRTSMSWPVSQEFPGIISALQVSTPREGWSCKGDRSGLRIWISPRFVSSPVPGWAGGCEQLRVRGAERSVWVPYPAAHFHQICKNILTLRLPCLLSELVGFDQRV